jgi:hypothetical protein
MIVDHQDRLNLKVEVATARHQDHLSHQHHNPVTVALMLGDHKGHPVVTPDRSIYLHVAAIARHLGHQKVLRAQVVTQAAITDQVEIPIEVTPRRRFTKGIDRRTEQVGQVFRSNGTMGPGLIQADELIVLRVVTNGMSAHLALDKQHLQRKKMSVHQALIAHSYPSLARRPAVMLIVAGHHCLLVELTVKRMAVPNDFLFQIVQEPPELQTAG